jgi:hypothetical protein
MLTEGEIGYYVTIVTSSGNKIQGTIIKDNVNTNTGLLKIKTSDGIIMLNSDAIESMY